MVSNKLKIVPPPNTITSLYVDQGNTVDITGKQTGGLKCCLAPLPNKRHGVYRKGILFVNSLIFPTIDSFIEEYAEQLA
jgi:hypothetical protein